MPDSELLGAIRREIAESPFVGEGHRKIRARLALRGIHTSGKRVLRLTRGAGLLAPTPHFARDYNEHWLLERHGYRTPTQARERLLRQAAMA